MSNPRDRTMAARRAAHPADNWMYTCGTCGKRAYETRAEAKKAGRVIDRTMSPYQCGNIWHVGHLPEPVAGGELARADIRNHVSGGKS